MYLCTEIKSENKLEPPPAGIYGQKKMEKQKPYTLIYLKNEMAQYLTNEADGVTVWQDKSGNVRKFYCIPICYGGGYVELAVAGDTDHYFAE